MPDAPTARLAIETQGGITTVSFPTGRFDGVAVREIYEAAIALTEKPHPKLLVDLRGVVMLPSGAAGILVAIRKKYLQHGGQLHLAGADPLVAQSIEVMNLHRMLQLFDTLEAAAAAFK